MKRKYVAVLLPMPSGPHVGLTLAVVVRAHGGSEAHRAASAYFQEKVFRSEPLAIHLLSEMTEIEALLGQAKPHIRGESK